MRSIRTGSTLRGPNGEGLIALSIVVYFIIVSLLQPTFFSVVTVFNVLNASYEPALLALGFLLILITGGIDVSFDAIGIFAGYTVVILITREGFASNDIVVTFGFAIIIGAILGLINAVFVARLRLPTLIVTLATRAVFAGTLLAFIGYSTINALPGGLGTFGNLNLTSVVHVGQSVGLQVLVIPVIVLAALLAVALRNTMDGRSIYALGAGDEVTRRSGFSIVRIRILVFCISGALDGAAGMVHITLLGVANPTDMVGNELTVIAAVVLGGASIIGGSGSVIGTLMGVVFIEIISYSLIVLGISSAWDNLAIGLALLFGILLQLWGSRLQTGGSISGPRLRGVRDILTGILR